MVSKFKKSIIVFFTVVFTVASVASPVAYAQAESPGQGNWWFPKYDDFLEKVNLAPANEIFGERYTHAQVSWIINSILNIMVGPMAACAGKEDFGGCLKSSLNGADAGVIIPLAMMSDSLLSTKPVSSVDYIAGRMERLGVVNEAYAQTPSQAGFGFSNSLRIIQDLWTVSRNAAYSLVILMILVLGFMVMFRAQLGAKTAVTIQSALPRVIIGLLLITFSYAIAGFLVDLTFVAQGVVAGILSSSALTGGQVLEDPVTAIDAFRQMNDVAGTIQTLFLSYIFGIFAIVFSAASADGMILIGVAAALATFVSLLALLLVAIVTLVSLVRIFWVMLRTYVVVVLLVAVSPFIFLYGIINAGINGIWFKAMISNLSVFFSAGLLLLICNILLFSTMPSNLYTQAFSAILEIVNVDVNPYNITFETVPDGNAVMPGFHSLGSTSVIGILISFGLFISTPKFVNSVRDFVASGRGDFGATGLNEASMGAAGAAAGYGISRAGRPNRERMAQIENDAKLAGQTPIDYVRSQPTLSEGAYRARQAAQDFADFLKRRR